jgi:tetratricopeptide (TPR) repeat protein
LTRERVPLNWAMTQNNLGNALASLGERESGTARLEQAVTAYEEALKERTRERVPLDWSMTQNNLGFVLATLGERQQANGQLEEASDVFQKSLAIRKELAATDSGNEEWQNALQSSVDAIGNLAYHFLLAKNFTKALQAADEAISQAPDKIWLHTNRAHALMFLGHEEEARVLYLRYRKVKDVVEEKSWETVILDDLAALRQAGLTHALMDEIETQFSTGG